MQQEGAPDAERNVSSSHDDDSSVSAASVDSDNESVVPHSNKQQDERNQVINLSSSETCNVRLWRTVVLILLVFAGVLVSTGTFLFLNQAEKTNYRTRVSTGCEKHTANSNLLSHFSVREDTDHCRQAK
jgi:hypothetical protein